MDDVAKMGAASVAAIVLSVPLGLLPGPWTLLGLAPLVLTAGTFVYLRRKAARRG